MIRIDGRTISVTQSNSGSIAFRMYGPDRKAFDLAGFTLIFMVKKSRKDPDSAAIIHKVVAPTEGNIATFDLLPADTRKPIATYWWGVQLVKGEYINEFASGPFYIKDGVFS